MVALRLVALVVAVVPGAAINVRPTHSLAAAPAAPAAAPAASPAAVPAKPKAEKKRWSAWDELIKMGKRIKSSVITPQPVEVKFYGESGCPYCRNFISGPLRSTLAAPGLSDIMNFEYIPWGNAYYVTSECKGAGQYNSTVRACYNQLCGSGATSKPSDCFTGQLLCQHGESECIGNKYLACAKNVTGSIVPKYMPFVYCLEEKYQPSFAEKDWAAIVETCSVQGGLEYKQVAACYSNRGMEVINIEAALTPAHPGVPYIVIDGKAMPGDTEDNFLQAVCDAYQGPAPAGCS